MNFIPDALVDYPQTIVINMRKKIFFVVFCAIQIGQLSAQSVLHTFSTNQTKFEYLEFIEELNPSELALFSIASKWDSIHEYPVSSLVQRIVDRDMNVIEERHITNDSLNLEVRAVEWSRDSMGFILVGNAYLEGAFWVDTIPYRTYLFAMKLDLDFNMKEFNLYNLQDTSLGGRFTLRRVKDSMYIGACYYFEPLSTRKFTYDVIYLLDDDAQFVKVRDYQEKSEKHRLISDIIENKNGEGYVGFGDFVYYYDNDLNILYMDSTQEMMELYFSQGHVKLLEDGSIIGGGSAGGDHISFYKLSPEYKLQKQVAVKLERRFIPYFMSDGRCVDSYDDNLIYSAQILKWGSKGLSVTLVDSNLVTKWIKYYVPRGDQRGLFTLSNVKAVKDGSCYIGGNLARRDLGPAFIMHINRDGDFLPVATVHPEGDESEIDLTLFPNPSHGDMHVRYSGRPSKVKLVLSDMHGKQVAVRTIFRGDNHFRFPGLVGGSYVYTLYSRGGEVIAVGQWMKE